MVCHPSVDLRNSSCLYGRHALLSVFSDTNAFISAVSWFSPDAVQPSLPYELASEGGSASGSRESYLFLQCRSFKLQF